jgi:hypothetical protein
MVIDYSQIIMRFVCVRRRQARPVGGHVGEGGNQGLRGSHVRTNSDVVWCCRGRTVGIELFLTGRILAM